MITRFIVYLLFVLGSISMIYTQPQLSLDTPRPKVQVQTDSVCKGQRASLAIVNDSTSQFQWYLQGKLVHKKASFQTPPLDSSTTYQVNVYPSPESTPYTVEVEAFVYNPSKISFNWTPSKVEVPRAEVQFQLQKPTLPVRSYLWNFGDGTSAKGNAPEHTYQYPGTYEISVKLEWSATCTQVISEMITVERKARMVFPSAFSPNGDGYNDVFQMEYQDLSTFKLNVYTRRGQLVYTTEDPNFVWQGKAISGKVVLEGLYICKIEAVTAEGEKVQQRHILTIIR
ncbi:MAG: gliding motility-associated C-terminal domain-containing protein [Bacteroidota bacterium]